MTRELARGVAFLALLCAAFAALVWSYDLPDPPAWRGLAILATGPVLFRFLNRFERPTSAPRPTRTTA